MARLVKRTRPSAPKTPNKLYWYNEQGVCKEAKDIYPSIRCAWSDFPTIRFGTVSLVSVASGEWPSSSAGLPARLIVDPESAQAERACPTNIPVVGRNETNVVLVHFQFFLRERVILRAKATRGQEHVLE